LKPETVAPTTSDRLTAAQRAIRVGHEPHWVGQGTASAWGSISTHRDGRDTGSRQTGPTVGTAPLAHGFALIRART
jgi:hypothetical protein